MLLLRRIQVCKWGGAFVAVVFLSQCFRRWKDFSQAPTPLAYAGILLALTLFLLLMAFLAVVVYGEEKAKGRLARTRPFFDRWSDRLFLNHDHGRISVGERVGSAVSCASCKEGEGGLSGYRSTEPDAAGCSDGRAPDRLPNRNTPQPSSR